MSICKVLVTALVLCVAACVDTTVDDSHEAIEVPQIGHVPNCPPGEGLVFSSGGLGACGGCTYQPGVLGQIEHELVRCSGEPPEAARAYMNICAPPC